MRIGIDINSVCGGGLRAGLYHYLRNLTRELRSRAEVWLLAPDAAGRVPPLNAAAVAELSAAFDGAVVQAVRPWRRVYRLWPALSACNRVDAFVHNLLGWFPPATRGGNVYVVPDVIPLAVDYGDEPFNQVCRRYYGTAVRHGDAVIVWAEFTKHDLLARVGGDAARIRVCPLAADPVYAPPTDPVAHARALHGMGLGGSKYVLCVSTVEKRKNHVVLVRAFAEMIRRDPALPHKLVFAGGKWIGHEEVFDAARELGDRFVYLGYADSLVDLYAGAGAFVFPSLYEGFGLPPLEAMACGTPTLAADAGSLPEVVGDAGVLFDPHDVSGLADRLHEVLTDRGRRGSLSERGLARANTFSWGRTADLYLAACRDAHALHRGVAA